MPDDEPDPFLTPLELAVRDRALVELDLAPPATNHLDTDVRFIAVDHHDGLAVAWSVARRGGGQWTEVDLVLAVDSGRRAHVLAATSEPWDDAEERTDAEQRALIRCPRRCDQALGAWVGYGGAVSPGPVRERPVGWVAGIAGHGVVSVSLALPGAEDRRRTVAPGTPFVMVVPAGGDEPVEVTLHLASGAVAVEVL